MTILDAFYESNNEENFLRELDADDMEAFIQAIIDDGEEDEDWDE